MRLPDGSECRDDFGTAAGPPSAGDSFSAGKLQRSLARLHAPWETHPDSLDESQLPTMSLANRILSRLGFANGGEVSREPIATVSPYYAGQLRKPDFVHPATLKPEQLFKTSELAAAYSANYDDSGSSRTTPVASMPDVPIGSWRIEDRWQSPRGRELSQLASLDPHKLEVSEFEVDGNWEGRRDDAERYADWMREGKQAPPIEVVETDSGKLKVSDGHRRHHAAKLAGQQILAWVSPNADTGLRTPNGQPITTALTDELAQHDWQHRPGFFGGGLVSKSLDWIQSGLDAAGIADPTGIADLANAGISLGRAAVDKGRRKEHLANAAVSGVSAIPGGVGDIAKLLKTRQYSRVMETVAGAGGWLKGDELRNPEARPMGFAHGGIARVGSAMQISGNVGVKAMANPVGFAIGGVQKLFQWNAAREVAGAIDEPNGVQVEPQPSKYVPGYTETIPADEKTGRVAIAAKIFKINEGKASVGWAGADSPQTRMPVESLPHFFADLAGKVALPADSGHPVIDAIASGQGEYLGKGHEGVVFGVGDKIAKMSTTVPYQPFNPGHRTPQEAKDMLRAEVERNNKLFVELAGKGILPQEYREHGDKAFAIRDRLDIPEKFTAKQVGQVRRTMDAMHDAGHVLGDTVQAGIKKGKPYLFDLGQARDVSKEPDQWQREAFDDDSNAFGRFATAAGHPEFAKPLAKTAALRFASAIKSVDKLAADDPDELNFVRHTHGGEWLKSAAEGLMLSGRFTEQHAADYGRAEAAGVLQGFARGGDPRRMPGPTDTIPALLTPGEVVLNKAQQQSLESITGTPAAKLFAQAGVPGFAGGGSVGRRDIEKQLDELRSLHAAEGESRKKISEQYGPTSNQAMNASLAASAHNYWGQIQELEEQLAKLPISKDAPNDPWRLTWTKTDVPQERVPPHVAEIFTEKLSKKSDDELRSFIESHESQTRPGGMLAETREHRRELMEAELRKRSQGSRPVAAIESPVASAVLPQPTKAPSIRGKSLWETMRRGWSKSEPLVGNKVNTSSDIVTADGGIMLDDGKSLFAEKATPKSVREAAAEKSAATYATPDPPFQPPADELEAAKRSEKLRQQRRREGTQHESLRFADMVTPSIVSGSSPVVGESKSSAAGGEKLSAAADKLDSAATKLSDAMARVIEPQAAPKTSEQAEREYADVNAKRKKAQSDFDATPAANRTAEQRAELDRLNKQSDEAFNAKMEAAKRSPGSFFGGAATPPPSGPGGSGSGSPPMPPMPPPGWSPPRPPVPPGPGGSPPTSPPTPPWTRRSTRDRLRDTLTGRAIQSTFRAVGRTKLGRMAASTRLGRFATKRAVRLAGSVGGRVAINSTLGGLVGGPLGSAGSAAGTLVGGAAGLAIGGTAVAVGALAKFVESLNEASKATLANAQATLEANRSLAKYSGSIAAAFARLDAARIRREQGLGAATSGTNARLAAAVNSAEEARQPLRAIGKTFDNQLGIISANISGQLSKMLVHLASLAYLDKIFRWLEGNAKPSPDLARGMLLEFMQRKPENDPVMKGVAAEQQKQWDAFGDARANVHRAALNALIPGLGNLLVENRKEAEAGRKQFVPPMKPNF